MTIEVIAECGVNHNGSVAVAKRLIDAAKKAGADTVKFQLFKTSELTTNENSLANYQKKVGLNSERQAELLNKLELSVEQHKELVDYCDAQEIVYLTSVFDEVSLDELKSSLKQSRVKFGSGELLNLPLIRKAALEGFHIILSTGMSDLSGVHKALKTISLAVSKPDALPTSRELDLHDYQPSIIEDRVTVLHCTSQYPTPISDINLLNIINLKNSTGLPVGLSDHSDSIYTSVGAVPLGITMLEKHFTLDRDAIGPDHRASLDPAQFEELVKALRIASESLGSFEKLVQEVEADVAKVAKKSLVAKRAIKRGEILSADNLCVKRPGTGISSEFFYDFIGLEAKRDFLKDQLIEP